MAVRIIRATTVYIVVKMMCYAILYIMLQEGNLEDHIAATNINHPYIAVVSMDFSRDMFLVIEREIICKIKTVFQAVQMLLSSFYVFNICYPNLLGSLFVFFKYYVFKLKLKERPPVSVSQLCSVL